MLIEIVLLIIAALLCLLLSMKVGVRVLFGEETRLWLKIGPAMVALHPLPEKKQKKEKKRETVESSAKPEKKAERNITFEAVWELVQSLAPPLLDAMERVRRGIRVERLSVALTISDADPAQAAQRFGKLNAFLWPFLAAVENVIAVKQRDVQLHLDFASKRSHAGGEVMITLRVFCAVRIFLRDGMLFLRPVLHFLKTTKAAPENGAAQKAKPTESAAA